MDLEIGAKRIAITAQSVKVNKAIVDVFDHSELVVSRFDEEAEFFSQAGVGATCPMTNIPWPI